MKKISKLFISASLLFIYVPLVYASACADNVSPTSDCDRLTLDESNLVITIANDITVGGLHGGDLINDIGASNTVTNNGVINSSGMDAGAAFRTYQNLGGAFINNGTANGLYSLFMYGTLDSVTNTGNMSGTDTGIYLSGLPEAQIGTLTNTGTISGYSAGIAMVMAGDLISKLDNSGTISSSGGAGIYLMNSGLGTGEISKLTNFGVIAGATYGIFNQGSITTLKNSGRIYGDGDIGLYNDGQIVELTNTGYGTDVSIGAKGVLGANVGIYNSNNASISVLNNSGEISSTGFAGINNDGVIRELNNTGLGLITGDSAGIYISSSGSINRLINSASITSSGTLDLGGGTAIQNSGYIELLRNTGQITSDNTAINNYGTIGIIDNSSAIISQSGFGINNQGTITSISNSGTISGINYGIANNSATIQVITNTGTISGGAGIYNWWGDGTAPAGSIVTLNNRQGVAGALFYDGKLPTNYNIIVNNTSDYGKLLAFRASGSTNFGIYNGSVLSKGTYTSVLSGLTAGTNVNATSGMYNGTGWRLVETGVGTGVWDLIADYSATNTLAGIQSNANALSTVYNQQAAAYQAALSYDCQVYDAAGLCVSVGGRYTYAGPSPSSNQQAGLVILGYKPVQTLRIGAFADQSVNISTPTGFSQSKTSPMWGFFAKWHKNKDEIGLGVQASAVTSSSSLTATRPQLFNTETGSGTTQFNGQGYQLTTNYHQPVTNNTSLVPYLGLRYTRINAGAYTENTTATVTSPLSYNAMAQNTFSAIGGIGVRSHLAEKLTGTASVGIQQNLNYSMGNYAGTSNIMGLESFSVQMPGNVNSMATASAGIYYDVRKSERVGFNILWQQQPFIATNTTTALATYTIGF